MRKVIQFYQEERLFLLFSSYVFLVNYLHIFAHQQLDSLYTLFVVSNLLLLLYALFVLRKKKQLAIPRIRGIEATFFLLIIAMDLSKIIHREYSFVLIPFLIFGKIIPGYIEPEKMAKFLYSNLIGIAPFLFYAIYSYNHYPSYYNNSMGVLLSINSYFLLLLLEKSREKKQEKEIMWLFFYLLLSLFTTYNTGSRTAILASILMVLYFIYDAVKNEKYLTHAQLKWTFPGLLVALYLARFQLIDIFNNLFFKWEGNGLDFSFTGRTDIWRYTLNNYAFFGGGKTFFIKALDVSHGHNLLFNILGFYGVIPFILIVIIILYGFKVFKEIDHLNVRLFIILFMLTNMFEGVIGGSEYSYFQLLFFLHFGLLMKTLDCAETGPPGKSNNSLGKEYERL